MLEEITYGGLEAAGAGLLRVAAGGLHREAAAAASLLRLLPPDDVEAASLRARALVMAGRPEAALRVYGPLPAAARETPSRATALRLLGRWQEAEQCLERCDPGRRATAGGPPAHEWTAECAALALDRGEPVLGHPARHWAQQALHTAHRAACEPLPHLPLTEPARETPLTAPHTTDDGTAQRATCEPLPHLPLTEPARKTPLAAPHATDDGTAPPPPARGPVRETPDAGHSALGTPSPHRPALAPHDPVQEASHTPHPALGTAFPPRPPLAPHDPDQETPQSPHPALAAPPQPRPSLALPDTIREAPRAARPTPGTAYARSLLAAAYAAAGLFGAALDAADAAVRELELLGEDALLRRLDAVHRVTDALFHTGRRHAAQRWLEAALTPARDAGQEQVAGRLELGLARARLAAEDHAAAGRWAERAAESARRTGGVPLAVDADLCLARIGLASGDSVAALTAARAAVRAARPLGGVWRDRAQARLREVRLVREQEAPPAMPAGAPQTLPRTPPTQAGEEDVADAARPSPATLSRREAQVALLVSEGCTNHQIAARLQVSPKTVETHLSRIFRKLGITSRAQVAHWVGVGAGPARDIGG